MQHFVTTTLNLPATGVQIQEERMIKFHFAMYCTGLDICSSESSQQFRIEMNKVQYAYRFAPVKGRR